MEITRDIFFSDLKAWKESKQRKVGLQNCYCLVKLMMSNYRFIGQPMWHKKVLL